MGEGQPQDPAIRAGVLQGNLVAFGSLGRTAQVEILGAVDPQILAAIKRASRIAWLPIHYDLHLTDIVVAAVGEAGLNEWARAAMLQSLETPLLQPLARAAFRLFGVSPGALLRAVPSGWKATFRNMGTVVYTSRTNAGQLRITGVPEPLMEDLTYMNAMCGNFMALLDVAGVDGSANVTHVDERERSITYVVDWS